VLLMLPCRTCSAAQGGVHVSRSLTPPDMARTESDRYSVLTMEAEDEEEGGDTPLGSPVKTLKTIHPSTYLSIRLSSSSSSPPTPLSLNSYLPKPIMSMFTSNLPPCTSGQESRYTCMRTSRNPARTLSVPQHLPVFRWYYCCFCPSILSNLLAPSFLLASSFFNRFV
jgi:hypothetical protein